MKVCVLGSGSGGNATLVEACGTRILIDAGFSGVELERRLRRVGVAPRTLAGIVLTHDHGDHSLGVGIFARRHRLPVYITVATLEACRGLFTGAERLVTYRAGHPFAIVDPPGDGIPDVAPPAGAPDPAADGSPRDEPPAGILVQPFVTVHDAVDPVAVTVVCRTNGTRVGIATDLGRPTAAIRHALAGCDFLVLEANHCRFLLGNSRYPASVKHRIASSHGHLSNDAAASLALELLHPRLAGILLAHLSEECNRPELARGVVGKALERAGFRGFLDVAPQDRPTTMIDVERLRAGTGPEQLSLL